MARVPAKSRKEEGDRRRTQRNDEGRETHTEGLRRDWLNITTPHRVAASHSPSLPLSLTHNLSLTLHRHCCRHLYSLMYLTLPLHVRPGRNKEPKTVLLALLTCIHGGCPTRLNKYADVCTTRPQKDDSVHRDACTERMRWYETRWERIGTYL